MSGLGVEQMVALAQRLVQIPSPTFDEAAAAAFLADAIKPHFDTVRVDSAHNVIAILDGQAGGPTVLLNGHLDHVDPGAMAEPYSGRLVDATQFGESGQAIIGRGSCDMKGAVAAMVAAAAEARERGFKGRLVLTAVSMEETGDCTGTRVALEGLGFRPDVALSGESTGGDICLGHRGRVLFELEVQGRTAHASNPSLGINAVELMNRFIDVWPRLPQPEDPFVGKCTSCITSIACSPGRLGVVPDRCTLVFDDRFLPGETPARPQRDVEVLLEELARTVPHFRYALKVQRVMLPYLVDPASPYVQKAVASVQRVTGRLPGIHGWLFGTDGTYLVNTLGIPTIGYGPGTEAQAHTPDEHVLVADLVRCKDVYVDFILNLQ